MTFKRIGSITEAAAATADIHEAYKAAQPFSRVRVGRERIFFSGLFTTEYAELTDVVWAYKRLEDTNMSLCCGHQMVEVSYLMIRLADGTQKKVEFESNENVGDVLEQIRQANPAADIGFTPELKEKYGI